ncbi:MAG TPA: hypothetical protein VGE51_14575 [Fontimonas sp.]
MRPSLRYLLAVGTIAVLLGASPGAGAEGVTATPPAQLPELSYKDASDKDQRIGPQTRQLYVSIDRAGGKLLEEALAGADQAQLDTQGAAVVADLSDAPRFIRPLIRSSLRKQKYSTWLDETGAIRKLVPVRENHITVVELDRFVVKSIRYIGDTTTLRQAFGITP